MSFFGGSKPKAAGEVKKLAQPVLLSLHRFAFRHFSHIIFCLPLCSRKEEEAKE